MDVFIWYFVLGISLAAPIGPVNAAQLNRGIQHGFYHSWLVGLGATCADGLYMLFVFLGVIHLLDIPFVQSFLWLFGFFVLIYTGVESIAGARRINVKDARSSGDTFASSFLSGFFVSLFNPLTVLFWLGIFGSILTQTVSLYSPEKVALFVSAIFLGLAVWDLTMAGLASTMRRFLTKKLLAVISVLSGLSLVGFGLYFGYRAFNVLFS